MSGVGGPGKVFLTDLRDRYQERYTWFPTRRVRGSS